MQMKTRDKKGRKIFIDTIFGNEVQAEQRQALKMFVTRCRGELVDFLRCRHLQSRSVNDLVVDGKFLAVIADDENADAATAIVKGIAEAVEQVALINDWETLFDITSLGHGDNATIVTDVEHAVLLEDWTEHVLDDNGWGWA